MCIRDRSDSGRPPAHRFLREARAFDPDVIARARVKWPDAVSVFALPTMPPLHIALLRELSRWIDVRIYALNPCREFWFDIVTAARAESLDAADRLDYQEVGHPLLAEWGRQTQAQLHMLHELTESAAASDASRYADNPAPTWLARVQNAILDLQPEAAAGAAPPAPLYDWRPRSTYIRRPPYWEGALAGERTLKGMRALAVLGDNITTDHLSPSNAILPTSAAGEYLAKMGLPEEDFNSYATHRGDHLTAQRATFANPTLVNEMAIVDGEVKKGSLARVEPDGKVMRMWEAIETYMSRKQPLVVIAGADYGQGSSRDWAAKGVRLAGVEAIVAEGFERIHRTNLIGMGVLPLEFKPGTNRATLAIDGTETFDVIGERTPRADLTLVIHRSSGERVAVPVTCRLDTAEEVSIYDAGGVLQRFAQDFLESSRAA